jgi:glycosyltransferase involved in cell wall biosynthesis
MTYSPYESPYEGAVPKHMGSPLYDAYPYLGSVSKSVGQYPTGYQAAVPSGLDYRRSYLGEADSAEGTRPLRAIHVSTHLLQAGIDQWLWALQGYSNPGRISFSRFVVTTDFVDHRQIARTSVPVEIGGQDSIRRACQDCDVLLVSDPGDHVEWFLDPPARLCVFVAHGDCHWTQERLNLFSSAMDHVVAVSKKVQRNMCRGYPSTVIHNGVDPVRLTATLPRDTVRASLGFNPEDFVLGFVGRFSAEKRPDAIIRAVARLPEHYKALLVGFGHLQQELTELAEQLIPGRYSFIRSDGNIGNLYSAMDAVSLVSDSEGYGLVIMEAMMCGLPVIVRSVGFVPEAIVDHENGLIVSGTPESISNAARQLAEDKPLAESIAAKASHFARTYGYASTMARRYEDLLWSLWKQKFSD